jgi:menaquinone-dependent protoporphyrinogen oxidase
MRQSVLVAYATKRGSTREVAEAVAEQLASHGLETTVARADEVKELAGFVRRPRLGCRQDVG